MCGALPLAVASAAVLAACEPLADSFDFDRQEVQVFQRSRLAPVAGPARPDRLRVMAWNIKFGAARIDFWFDYWGDRVQLTRAEVERNVAALCALIREHDPDVLMAEEIEVNSRRSAYYDMVQAILEQTSLNYAAYFQTWDSRYVLSEGLGRIDLGNAIFSKRPMSFAERIRQADRTDQSALTRTFYIHRMIGRAVIPLGGSELAAYVVHTEAYDRDGTKAKHIQQIYDEVTREPRPAVVGGDFNELPPNAVKRSDFSDEHPRAKGSEFEQPPYTPELMQKLYDALVPWITLGEYGKIEAEQRRYYSHSVLGPEMKNARGEVGFWNRTLDYLFASKKTRWVAGASDVLQSPGRLGIESDPMQLSDHAPVVGTWLLP
jgi:endonuclease/exonuclease/phosphatase family metal-dependent hydrolase